MIRPVELALFAFQNPGVTVDPRGQRFETRMTVEANPALLEVVAGPP